VDPEISNLQSGKIVRLLQPCEKYGKKDCKLKSKKIDLFVSNKKISIDINTSNKSIRSIDSFSMKSLQSSKRCPKENGIMDFLQNELIFQLSVKETMSTKFFNMSNRPIKNPNIKSLSLFV
jgi:hypothetical protein